jgi:hypothetical protein
MSRKSYCAPTRNNTERDRNKPSVANNTAILQPMQSGNASAPAFASQHYRGNANPLAGQLQQGRGRWPAQRITQKQGDAD